MADEYHKIAGPFVRDKENLKRIKWGEFISPTVEMLANSPIWNGTEKIDGTNIRVVWDGHRFSIGGRSDRAQLHKDLIAKIESYFLAPGVEEEIEETFGEKEVIFVGEGYGAGIQKGGIYSPDKEFIGFDIRVGGKYVSQESVEEIYRLIDVPYLVPVSHKSVTLWELIDKVAAGFFSPEAYMVTGHDDILAEGIVARPVRPLYGSNGERIIVKLKHDDLWGY